MTAKLQQAGSRKRRYNQDKFEDIRNSPSPNLVHLPHQQPQQVSNNPPIYSQSNKATLAMYDYSGSTRADTSVTPSNQVLTKRQPNNQIATATYNNSNEMDYNPIPMEYDTLSKPISNRRQAPADDLEQRALAAQRDTISKRKQIPPFVQKLSR